MTIDYNYALYQEQQAAFGKLAERSDVVQMSRGVKQSCFLFENLTVSVSSVSIRNRIVVFCQHSKYNFCLLLASRIGFVSSISIRNKMCLFFRIKNRICVFCQHPEKDVCLLQASLIGFISSVGIMNMICVFCQHPQQDLSSVRSPTSTYVFHAIPRRIYVLCQIPGQDMCILLQTRL